MDNLHAFPILFKFQLEVIKDITCQPRRAIEVLPTDYLPIATCNRLQRKGAEIHQNFYIIFMQFADVHQTINHANPPTELDIDRTGKISYLCSQFGSCTPSCNVCQIPSAGVDTDVCNLDFCFS